jgi:hypothetical protein
MRKLAITLVSAALLAAAAYAAAEDHRPYRTTPLADCNECHREANVTVTHEGGWNRGHGLLAAKEGNNCDACHEQGFCTDCHYGGGADAKPDASNSRGPDYKPKSHRSDFREIHPIAAMDAPRSCEKCHDARYCRDCHAKFQPEELQFSSHRRGWSDLRATAAGPRHGTFSESMCQTCHPGSVLPKHEWTKSHAREARRNLASCQSCHYDGDVCLKCHSAKAGLMVNPHPDNWGSIKGNLDRAAGKRTCVKCH